MRCFKPRHLTAYLINIKLAYMARVIHVGLELYARHLYASIAISCEDQILLEVRSALTQKSYDPCVWPKDGQQGVFIVNIEFTGRREKTVYAAALKRSYFIYARSARQKAGVFCITHQGHTAKIELFF